MSVVEVTARNGDEYRKVLRDEESLSKFLEAMAKFDREFCEAMFRGKDYTLKLEVHGCNGKLIHARVTSDTFDRPKGAKKTNRKNSRET